MTNRRGALRPRSLASLLIPAGLLLLAFADGGLDLAVRQQWFLVVSWVLLGLIVFGVVPRSVPVRGLTLVIAGLGGLCCWQLIGAFWGPSVDRALSDAARTGGYLAVFALASST